MHPDSHLHCHDCARYFATLHTVRRWHGLLEEYRVVELCDDCAEEQRARTRRERARDAYEAHCDDVGGRMRAGEVP